MNISWLGYSCFKIEIQSSKKATAVTDPFAAEGRIKLSRTLEADLVTSSLNQPRHNAVSEVGGKPFVVDGPGEYEASDISVIAMPVYHERKDDQQGPVNTVCYFLAEELHLLHLGGLKRKLEESDLQDLHEIDILFVPVGGGEVLEAKQAAEVVSQVEPRIVIPMHYASGKFDGGLQGVEPFLKALGKPSEETVNKLKITPRGLPQDEMQVVVMEPQ